MKAIEVDHLTVSYGQEPVVRNVDFAVECGAVTGLIGPNGGGKSTVIKATLGLIPFEAGSVRIRGGRPETQIPRHVAYLPQRSSIDANYPVVVEEVVRMGRLPHRGLWGRLSSLDRAAVTDAIHRVGLDGLERRPLGALSGGQQQRAHFARALAQQPSIYVLDEPFTGIDAPTADLLAAMLRRLASEGAAVLLVEHDLRQVRRTCDRLILLNGTVVTVGPTDRVLRTEEILQAYGTTPADVDAGR